MSAETTPAHAELRPRRPASHRCATAVLGLFTALTLFVLAEYIERSETQQFAARIALGLFLAGSPLGLLALTMLPRSRATYYLVSALLPIVPLLILSACVRTVLLSGNLPQRYRGCGQNLLIEMSTFLLIGVPLLVLSFRFTFAAPSRAYFRFRG